MGDVTPGNLYSIKLVIADETDTAFDIAVFLEAGSFNIGDVDLGIDLTAANNAARCEGETYTIVPDLTVPGGTTFEWQFEDPPGSGIFVGFMPPEVGPTLDVTDNGLYKLIVDFNGTCEAEGQVAIEFLPAPTINTMPDPLVVCDDDNDGFAEFTLSNADNDITGGNPDIVVTYHGTRVDAENGVLPLPNLYTNDDPYNDIPVTDPIDPAFGTGGVWARAESINSSCFDIAPLALEVRDSPMAVEPAPLRKCDDSVADGFTFFDLTVVSAEVLGGLDPTQFDLYWYEDFVDAQTAGDVALTMPDFSGAIPTPTNYFNNANPQIVWILVVGNMNSTMPNNGSSGCYDIVPLELIVDPNPEDFGPFEMFLCNEAGPEDPPTATFDLTTQNGAATGGDTDLTVTWFETLADEAADMPIPDPTMYQNTATPQTIFGRVESLFGCRTIITLTLTVLPNPTPNFDPTPIELCDNEDDTGDFDNGISSGFDPTIRDAEIIGPEMDVNVSYYETLAEAEVGDPATAIVPPYTNITPNLQTIFARVERDVPPAVLDCYTIVELDLIVIELPDAPVTPDFQDPFQVCDDDGDGIAVFDLTLQNPGVYGMQNPVDFEIITYYTSLADAQASVPGTEIDPANAFPSAGQTIWVRLEEIATGCFRITPFELVVGTFPTAGAGNDLFECDDEASGDRFDGLSTFDLTVNEALLNPNGEPGLFYYATAAQQIANDPITNPGAYQNELSPVQEIFVSVINAEGCPATSSFFITVEANPNVVSPTPLIGCDDDDDGVITDFDLTLKDAEIIGTETDVTVTYYDTEADANSQTDPLVSPYTNIVPFNQTIWARVVRNTPPGVNPCFTIITVDLVVEQRPEAPNPENHPTDPFRDLRMCDEDGDGSELFDLSLNDAGAIGEDNVPNIDFTVDHYTDLATAEAGVPGTEIDPDNAFPSTGQTIWTRVTNVNTGCFRISTFEVIVDELPVLAPEPFGLEACQEALEGGIPVATFDLITYATVITDGNQSYTVTYFEVAGGDPIADPGAYQNTANPQVIVVTVSNGECEVETQLTLTVVPTPTPEDPEPLVVCDGDDTYGTDDDYRDGIAFFQLSDKDAEILGNEMDATVSYHATEAEAIEGINPLPNIYQNITVGGETVWARVTRDAPPALLPCAAVVALELVVAPLPADEFDIEDELVCQQTVVLEEKDPEIEAFLDPNEVFVIYYYTSLADAQAGNTANALDKTSPLIIPDETIIYVGIENGTTNCYIGPTDIPGGGGDVTLSFTLFVREGAQAFEPAPYVICDNLDPNDGIANFTLLVDPANPTDLDPEAQDLADQILGGQDPMQFALSFHPTQADADTGENPLPTIYQNISNPQVIYARVTNVDAIGNEGNVACYATTTLTLKVEQLPPILLEEEYRICVDANGDPIEAESGEASPPLLDTGITQEGYTFLWELNGVVLPNEIGPAITAIQPGVYTVTVTELDTGCSAQAIATVITSSPPIIFGAEATQGAFAGDHVIEAFAEGEGIYQFQLDGGPFQDSGTFNGVEPGTHIVTITDINGCGSVTIEVGIVDYPRLLTPNQDGFHDTWNIIGIAQADPSARIYIFDRFGKLLKQISPLGEGWDGTYNGNPLPSSDYWFRIEYQEQGQNKEFKGHFTLKR